MKYLLKSYEIFFISALIIFCIGMLYLFQKKDVIVPRVDDKKEDTISYTEGFFSKLKSDEGDSVSNLISSLKKKSAFEQELYAVSDDPIRTNQWFSSLYFKEGSEPLFSYPWSVRFSQTSVELGYPLIETQKTIIKGVFAKHIEVSFNQEIESLVLQSDDLLVKVLVRGKKDQKDILVVTITRGSPFVFFEGNLENVSLQYSGRNVSREQNGMFIAQAPMNAFYGAFFESEEDIILDENEQKITSRKGKEGIFSLAIIPEKSSLERFYSFAFDPIEEASADFELQGDDQYINSFSYKTKEKKETLIGLFLWQKDKENLPSCLDIPLQTIRGKQYVCQGNVFLFSSLRRVPQQSFPVNLLSEEEKDRLRVFLQQDINDFSHFTASDTYFLGKELVRVGQLMDMAFALNMEEEGNKIKGILSTLLNRWRSQSFQKDKEFGSHYIAFDDRIRGIVGYSPSFGSEMFNDHHFHYGYFAHAGAILSRYNELFLQENRDLLNLFVYDYLFPKRESPFFSFLRNFDMYEGHSWASGTALFSDGNNQESSSESIHAYYGAYLWFLTNKNEDFSEVALWLYNREIDSALRYSFVDILQEEVFSLYESELASLVWGGKMEYNTWFSPDAGAKLGIQILPIHVGSLYLKENRERIERDIAKTAFPKKENLFFDYLLMYYAIKDPQEAMNIFEKEIQKEDIDGGNSQSLLYLWISLMGKKELNSL